MGLVGAFYLFLQKTSFGKAIRATGRTAPVRLWSVCRSRRSALVFVSAAPWRARPALFMAACSPSHMVSGPLMKGFILTVLGRLSMPGTVPQTSLGWPRVLARYFSAAFNDGYGFIL
jgi:branched-subunit amino acid ABC-type transport system permease component